MATRLLSVLLAILVQQGVPQGQRIDAAAKLAGYFCDKGHPENITLEILRSFGERCAPPDGPARA